MFEDEIKEYENIAAKIELPQKTYHPEGRTMLETS